MKPELLPYAGNPIPEPEQDVVREQEESYTGYYLFKDSDSPKASRDSLVARVAPYLSQEITLDLGAGKGILESEMAEKGIEGRIVTVELARFKGDQLLTKGTPSFFHIRASGWQEKEYEEHTIAAGLPFKDGAFPAAISGMALDFMPKEAHQEFVRVVQPDGRIFANFHHPSLIPPNIKILINLEERSQQLKQNQGKELTWEDVLYLDSLKFKRYLKLNNILFTNHTQINAHFSNLGLIVDRVEEVRDEIGNTWWEADMRKAA